MNVKQCDRCGEIISKKCAYETSVITYIASKDGYTYLPRNFDLCHKCSKSFVEWIKKFGNVD